MKIFKEDYDISITSIDKDSFRIRDELLNRITESIFDTREKVLRDKLIDMGWTPPTEVKFKVGDAVRSSENGTGIVKEYNEREPYPVWVVFDAKCGVSYTDDGRSYKSKTITLTKD